MRTQGEVEKALTESLEARSAMDCSSTRPLPAAAIQSYEWMDADSLGQTSMGQAPEEAHHPCEEPFPRAARRATNWPPWVPRVGAPSRHGQPPGKGASSLGRSPTLGSSINETGPQPVALLARGRAKQHTTLAPPRSRYRICHRDGDKQSVS